MVMCMRRYELLFLMVLLIGILLCGAQVHESCQRAMNLWWNNLIPGMLLPMILIRLIQARGGFDHLKLALFNKLFNMENNGFACFMCALLLGFPNGALFIDELYENGQINSEGAKRMIKCCSFPTTGFVILSLGTALYRSAKIGWTLYSIQILSGLILLALTRKTKVCPAAPRNNMPTFFPALTDAILKSGRAMFLIGIYLMMFLSIFHLVQCILPGSLSLPLQIISEFSNGCIMLAQSSLPLKLQLTCISALLGFGGLCVHMQVLSSLRIHIPYHQFLCYRICQAIIAATLTFIMI